MQAITLRRGEKKETAAEDGKITPEMARDFAEEGRRQYEGNFLFMQTS